MGRPQLDSRPGTCCAVGCESAPVLVSKDVPLCEQHVIAAYRAIGEFLNTQQAVRARSVKYTLVGKPFGICPSCDLVLLTRNPDDGDVKCIYPSCGYTASAPEFRKLCDRRIRELSEHSEVVYYLRFGDRVKIGTTKNLEQRLIALPHDEVMATEPGGIHVEQQRHKQFGHLRIRTGSHREWFQLTPELAQHIAAVRARQDAAA